jgi:hypothetical protein
MKMSIHVELKEALGGRIPAFVVTNNQGDLRWEIWVSRDCVEEELVNALQGLIKRFDDRCVTILKHFLFLVHQMLYVIARIC